MAKSFGAESLGADGFAVRGPVSAAPAVGCALVETGSNQLGWTSSPIALNADLLNKVSKSGDTMSGQLSATRLGVGAMDLTPAILDLQSTDNTIYNAASLGIHAATASVYNLSNNILSYAQLMLINRANNAGWVGLSAVSRGGDVSDFSLRIKYAELLRIDGVTSIATFSGGVTTGSGGGKSGTIEARTIQTNSADHSAGLGALVLNPYNGVVKLNNEAIALGSGVGGFIVDNARGFVFSQFTTNVTNGYEFGLFRSTANEASLLKSGGGFADFKASRFITYNANGSPSIDSYSNAGINIYKHDGSLGVARANEFQAMSNGYFYFASRGMLTSSANGVLHVQNYDANDSVAQALVLGPGTTATNGVRLTRDIGSSILKVRNGNNADYAIVDAGQYYVQGSSVMTQIGATLKIGAGFMGSGFPIEFGSGAGYLKAGTLDLSGTLVQGTLDARWTIPATGKRSSELGNGAGTWQTGFREEYNAGGVRHGFFGVTPVARQSIAAAATDAASTQTLANSLRTAFINLGLGV